MLRLYVADVGDGLAAGIRTVSGSRIQIDCGTQRSRSTACVEALRRIYPDSFFLSHFHADHYSGLFSVGLNEKFEIARVLFPRLPVFPEQKEFMFAMLAMSYYVLGASSGSQEADFITQIKSITRVKSTYQKLSTGDSIDINGSHFEVLWPPRILDDSAISKVKTAIKDFNNALEQDEKLRQLHKRIQESNVVDYYLRDDSELVPLDSRESASKTKPLAPPDKLLEPVRRANESLRGAANHFSLALYEDNRFLFLGDLEKPELKKVADTLVTGRRTNFLATITPHHGTHWHPHLQQIKTHYAVSSAGEKLIPYFCPEFKSFGRRCLVTHSNGDIHIPNPFDFGLIDPIINAWCRAGFCTFF